jgi:Protein of unknown function (DUF2846)
MKRIISLAAIAFSMLLIGCAAPMKAAPEQDRAAKVFTPLKDKATLFVYRNENFGGGVGMPIKVNGQDIGETGAKTFFRLNLASGMYVIASEAENTSELPVTVVEGRNYFVWQEARMGIWKARTALRSVDEKTGMDGVLESVLLTPKVSEDVLSKTAIKR